MPEAHLILRGDLDLVAEDLVVALVIAADLNAGVAGFIFEVEAEDEVGRSAPAPDDPVPGLLLPGAGDGAVDNLPCALAVVPLVETLAIENGGEASLVVRCSLSSSYRDRRKSRPHPE